MCMVQLLKGDVVAVATMGRDPVAVAVRELMQIGKMPKAYQVVSGEVNGDVLLAMQKELSGGCGCKGKGKAITDKSGGASVSVDVVKGEGSGWLQHLLPAFLLR